MYLKTADEVMSSGASTEQQQNIYHQTYSETDSNGTTYTIHIIISWLVG